MQTHVHVSPRCIQDASWAPERIQLDPVRITDARESCLFLQITNGDEAVGLRANGQGADIFATCAHLCVLCQPTLYEKSAHSHQTAVARYRRLPLSRQSALARRFYRRPHRRPHRRLHRCPRRPHRCHRRLHQPCSDFRPRVPSMQPLEV